nr:hypothetical protein [Arthrobacter sp. yr096]
MASVLVLSARSSPTVTRGEIAAALPGIAARSDGWEAIQDTIGVFNLMDNADLTSASKHIGTTR